ncbi:MAG: hypothetical protein R6U98_36195, partial [Pirellulaceae bacterium]
APGCPPCPGDACGFPRSTGRSGDCRHSRRAAARCSQARLVARIQVRYRRDIRERIDELGDVAVVTGAKEGSRSAIGRH